MSHNFEEKRPPVFGQAQLPLLVIQRFSSSFSQVKRLNTGFGLAEVLILSTIPIDPKERSFTLSPATISRGDAPRRSQLPQIYLLTVA